MRQNEKFEKLTAGQDVNTIVEKIEKMSPKGQRLFAERIEEEYAKLSKINKPKRPAKIEAIADEIMEKYLRKDLRPVKEKVDRRLTVLQIDKATDKVIAEHESVQAAHRATNISDGSICYCCLGRPGFKTAGGFKWAYKKDWGVLKPEAEVTEAEVAEVEVTE